MRKKLSSKSEQMKFVASIVITIFFAYVLDDSKKITKKMSKEKKNWEKKFNFDVLGRFFPLETPDSPP